MNRKPKSDLTPTIPDLNPNGYAQDNPKATEYITETRSYKLITPLFGGGVEAGVNDTITPIRASGIRGQLRFWWRAIRGGSTDPNLSDSQRLDDMRQREAEIWGSASTNTSDHPCVDMAVQIISSKEACRPSSDLSYITFPLNPLKGRGKVIEEIEFTLTITYRNEEAYVNEIQAALWAWENFGGIGGRTRRGFGSFYCSKINDKHIKRPKSINKQEILNKIHEYINDNIFWPDNVPHLSKNIIIYVSEPSKDAWYELISKLRNFRQKRDKNNRNQWREVDEIRRLSKEIANNQELIKNKLIKSNINKFPRSIFGLPIIFDLLHDKPITKNTLTGLNYNRLASPLIIKALACQKDLVAGFVFILEGTNLPDALRIEIEDELSNNKYQVIIESDILNQNKPILQAFIKSLGGTKK